MTDMLHCRPGRPFGIHPRLFNDEDCPRCGWTAPGPIGDARLDAIEAAAEAAATSTLAARFGWSLPASRPLPDAGLDEPLAA